MQTMTNEALFLTGPIAQIQNQEVMLYDPLKKETKTASLLNPERNRSLLFFYPADFSFVCPTELAKLNTLYGEFHREGVEIVVISRDSLLVHQKRIEIEPSLTNFKIKMISDKEALIGKKEGLINTATGEYERATLICSPTGKVAYLQISNASIGRNIEELLRVIRALNHLLRHEHRLCQENRQDGQAGISLKKK